MSVKDMVMEGLERCRLHDGSVCKNCGYSHTECVEGLCADALKLIKQQQEEIDRLHNRLNRKSRWIVNTKKYGEDNYHCLLCGAIVEKDEAGRHYWQRCYHCGAYMELMDGTDRDYDKDGEQK